MNEIDEAEFRKAIRATHGSDAQLVRRERVYETFEGETVWEGEVLIFRLIVSDTMDLRERRCGSMHNIAACSSCSRTARTHANFRSRTSTACAVASTVLQLLLWVNRIGALTQRT